MKRFLFIGFVILCWLPLLGLLWMGFDLKENRGFHFGYYGELNKIVDTLDTIPEVESVWVAGYNADVTLEEMGVGIETEQGEQFEIWFGQDDPIRELSGQDLAQALLRRIAEETTSKRSRGG